jgi:ESS family glutamate:Na+ symporter
MGYGQGPGQAYNWGHVYETATAYAPFQYGGSFGLTIAAMGFVSAGLGGVIYLQQMKKKGQIKTLIDNADEVEDLTVESITEKGEIPLSESLDKLTVQIGLVVFTYMAAYGVMYLISLGLDSLGGFFTSTVKPLIWGFNFLIGTVMAILVRNVLKGLTNRGRRQYLNNFMLARISGVMFDLMVVASIAAIDLAAFTHREFIIPLSVVCIVGAAATYLQLSFVSRRIYPEYPHEAFLSLYGMLTGTASTGVILLREIDPLFKTPAASNLVYQQLWAIVFGFPMLLLLGIAPIGLTADPATTNLTNTWITLAALIVLFVVMNVILFRRDIFKKKEKA